MEGWVNEWIEEKMDKWTDAWMDEQKNGWMMGWLLKAGTTLQYLGSEGRCVTFWRLNITHIAVQTFSGLDELCCSPDALRFFMCFLAKWAGDQQDPVLSVDELLWFLCLESPFIQTVLHIHVHLVVSVYCIYMKSQPTILDKSPWDSLKIWQMFTYRSVFEALEGRVCAKWRPPSPLVNVAPKKCTFSPLIQHWEGEGGGGNRRGAIFSEKVQVSQHFCPGLYMHGLKKVYDGDTTLRRYSTWKCYFFGEKQKKRIISI